MSGTRSSVLDVMPVLAAVTRAPSVHATQPWTLQPGPDGVDLLERVDVSLPYHDPRGKGRVMSCGAALTNLTTAIRAQGFVPDVDLFPDRGRPELLATVTAVDAEPPQGVDLRPDTAVQRAWLAAVARGLVASVVTQPWQLPTVRASLTRLLGGTGLPQAMLRVGRPTVAGEWTTR